jgi:hypothetical protein
MSDDCGCCASSAGLDENSHENRPGLPEISYRLGTFATFRQNLLDNLSLAPELSGLRSRVSDDYSISTVEMWSAVADIVTFYSERIANDGFIRTATSRDAVLHLARLLDYQLAPGLAARTLLAFTLEPGATATIPARTRVQSTPTQGQKAQKYETLDALAADWRLNRLRLYPAPIPQNPFEAGSLSAIAAPDAAANTAVARLAKGDQVLVFSPTEAQILAVDTVTAEADLLTVKWTKAVTATTVQDAATGAQPNSAAFKLGRTFRLFGVDAPVAIAHLHQIGEVTKGTVEVETLWTDFSLSTNEKNGTALGLDARYDNLTAGQVVLAVAQTSGKTTVAPFSIASAKPNAAQRTAGGTAVASGTVTELSLTKLGDVGFDALDPGDIRMLTFYELLGDPLRFWPYEYPTPLTSESVYLPGARVGWSTIEVGRSLEKGKFKTGILVTPADFADGKRVLVSDDAGAAPTVTTVDDAALTGSDVTITAVGSSDVIAALGLGAGATRTTTVVSAPLQGLVKLPRVRTELAVTIGTAPTQTVTVNLGAGFWGITMIANELQTAIRDAMPADVGFALATVWADTGPDYNTILAAAGIPGMPIQFAHTDNDEVSVAAIGLDAAHARFADGLLSAPLLPGPITGSVRVAVGATPPQQKAITLAAGGGAAQRAEHLSDQLGLAVGATAEGRLVFMPRLPRLAGPQWLRVTLSSRPTALDSGSAHLLGNVAGASHGETVRDEIVGDGDASSVFQKFPLAKKPVTVLSAATTSGIESSLQLFVNAERWTEVSSLYSAGAADHVYTTHTADDGTTGIAFGDGEHGARPPTGRQNIVATYRQGSGLIGQVPTLALHTPLDRPVGLKAVTNPMPGEGGSDPESLENARTAAPASVRTFGRAVSLLDFEDATLTHREVAKASAQWVWAGDRRVVHVTVAGAGGETFSAAALARIAARLHAVRDPNRALLLGNYIPIAVTIAASLIVDASHISDAVLEVANTALRQAFSFDQRGFAEPVYLSDVYAVLQTTAGVVGVDIDVLDLKTRDPAVRKEHGVDTTADPAKPRLLMLPARWSPTLSVVAPAELAVIEVPALDIVLRTIGGAMP